MGRPGVRCLIEVFPPNPHHMAAHKDQQRQVPPLLCGCSGLHVQSHSLEWPFLRLPGPLPFRWVLAPSPVTYAEECLLYLPPTTGSCPCPRGQCTPSHRCPDRPRYRHRAGGALGGKGAHRDGLPNPRVGESESPFLHMWAQKALPCSLEDEGTRPFTLLLHTMRFV